MDGSQLAIKGGHNAPLAIADLGPGEHDIVLTLTDGDGNKAEFDFRIMIDEIATGVADDSAIPPAIDIAGVVNGKLLGPFEAEAGGTIDVTFDASGTTDISSIPGLSYEWAIDMGQDVLISGAESATAVARLGPGNYEVTLSVTDKDGNVSKRTFAVIVDEKAGDWTRTRTRIQIQIRLQRLVMKLPLLKSFT